MQYHSRPPCFTQGNSITRSASTLPTFSFEQNLFEAASALGTLGLSVGITSALSDAGKVLIILLMFCGRMGPLTLGLAFFHQTPTANKTQKDDLAI